VKFWKVEAFLEGKSFWLSVHDKTPKITPQSGAFRLNLKFVLGFLFVLVLVYFLRRCLRPPIILSSSYSSSSQFRQRILLSTKSFDLLFLKWVKSKT
jgi:hypothetical protein